MTVRNSLVLAAAVLAAAAGTARAQDAAAGRRVAAGICQACHGLDGLPKMPEMPTIGAADAAYLVKQLKAYRDGTRQNEMMSAVAPMLDDQKMADVAAYYAAVKLEVAP